MMNIDKKNMMITHDFEDDVGSAVDGPLVMLMVGEMPCLYYLQHSSC